MRVSALFGSPRRDAPGIDHAGTASLVRGGLLHLDGDQATLLPAGHLLDQRLLAALHHALPAQQVHPWPERFLDGLSGHPDAALLWWSRHHLQSYRQLPVVLHGRIGHTLHWVQLGLEPGADLHAALLAPFGLPLHRRIQPVAHGEQLAWTVHPEVPAEPVDLTGTGGPLQTVATPGATTIASLCEQLDVSPSQTAKALMLTARIGDQPRPQLVLAVVRGDQNVDLAVLAARLDAWSLQPATPEQIQAGGMVPGYAGPMGLDPDKVLIVADPAVVDSPGLVAGANQAGHHVRHLRHGRDWQAQHVFPIAEGGPLPAPVFTQTHYRPSFSSALAASVLGPEGRPVPVQVQSASLDLAALRRQLAVQHATATGLCWPESLSPWDLAVLSLVKKAPEVEQVEALVGALEARGVQVLYDDRSKVSPGAKFAECDLRGVPRRVVVSAKGLADGVVELRVGEGEPQQLPLTDLVALSGR